MKTSNFFDDDLAELEEIDDLDESDLDDSDLDELEGKGSKKEPSMSKEINKMINDINWRELQDSFVSAKPFNHVIIDNFLENL